MWLSLHIQRQWRGTLPGAFWIGTIQSPKPVAMSGIIVEAFQSQIVPIHNLLRQNVRAHSSIFIQ